MKVSITLVSLVISILVFFVFLSVEKMFSAGGFKAAGEDNYKIKSRYLKIRKFLSESGADYMAGAEINPFLYDFVNLMTATASAFCAGKILSIWAVLPGFIAGFKLTKTLLTVSNKRDNKAIMSDIKAMYDTLLIKTEAGMFFSESLPECYKSVSNKRLKDALIRMNSEIAVHNDISSAINNFQAKFRSEYIDTFCIIVRQALESGQTLQILNDMSSQLNDIQRAVNEQKKAKMERDVMTVQLLVYAVMIIIIVYYIFSIIGSFAIDAL